jgi:shikimate kinase
MPTPLVLTGGPAVGKSTTGRLLARRFTRAAFIDVDDIRQLVIAGSAAPWEGAEGLAQQELGVLRLCIPRTGSSRRPLTTIWT